MAFQLDLNFLDGDSLKYFDGQHVFMLRYRIHVFLRTELSNSEGVSKFSVSLERNEATDFQLFFF